MSSILSSEQANNAITKAKMISNDENETIKVLLHEIQKSEQVQKFKNNLIEIGFNIHRETGEFPEWMEEKSFDIGTVGIGTVGLTKNVFEGLHKCLMFTLEPEFESEWVVHVSISVNMTNIKEYGLRDMDIMVDLSERKTRYRKKPLIMGTTSRYTLGDTVKVLSEAIEKEKKCCEKRCKK